MCTHPHASPTQALISLNDMYTKASAAERPVDTGALVCSKDAPVAAAAAAATERALCWQIW